MKRSWLPRHNGGPVEKLPVPERSKRIRGLIPTYPPSTTHSTVIVRNGKIVSEKRFAKIAEQVLASRAMLDAQPPLSPGFRNQPPQAGRERPGSGGIPTNVNRTCPQDPVAGERDHVDERALSR